MTNREIIEARNIARSYMGRKICLVALVQYLARK